ncbi:ferrous iron transport protein A [Thermodesulfovibrio aggregans]|uniref:Ferrous iron transport protein A n=1 Tax=Thermodesulfovibrio aggregans TaxID=86166 RepID=A0A0U9HR61_9BACT|nr:FeoA domain-containing protein [Thermodesulfovibrio aggregans]GAQ94905.1 ferrous iron transport protein A [Thermodesulfovibrio aggregans]
MKTLLDINNGKRVKILKISGGKGVRQHLQCLGIHIGDIVTLKKSSFLGGPVLLEVNGFDVALGRGVASKIEVEEIE